ncbi:MAG: hypothetical protein ACTSQE_05165 [Candidatus Heimdallarchaeaceae archaeon]
MKQNIRKADIESIELLSSVGKKRVEIKIEGYLRDTGYELKKERIDYNENTRTVNITLTASRDPRKMATQALVKFKRIVELNFPLSGKWKINCNNKEISIDLDSF